MKHPEHSCIVCGSAKWSNHLEIWKFHFRNHRRCLIKLKTNSLYDSAFPILAIFSWEMKIYAHKKDYVQGYVDEKCQCHISKQRMLQVSASMAASHFHGEPWRNSGFRQAGCPEGHQGVSHCSSLQRWTPSPGSSLTSFFFCFYLLIFFFFHLFILAGG